MLLVGENMMYVEWLRFLCPEKNALLTLLNYYWRGFFNKIKSFFEISEYTNDIETIKNLTCRLHQGYLGTVVVTA